MTRALLDRRTFTLQSALALLSGVTITVSGCGSTETPTSPTTPANVSATVSANHGHQATITGAQITAQNALSLNIQGQADHPHTVELTQANLAAIATRQSVSVQSTTDNFHSHTVTFQMA